MVNPLAWQADFDGYQVIVFLHERGIFSVLIVGPTDEPDLVPAAAQGGLRRRLPGHPRARRVDRPGRGPGPITDVLPGGALRQPLPRARRGADGALALPGLVFVGDAVCTTTPMFGRGMTTSLLQARELLRLIDEHGADSVAVGRGFDAWCAANMRPWVEDHVRMDDDGPAAGRARTSTSTAAAVGPDHGGRAGRSRRSRRRSARTWRWRPARRVSTPSSRGRGRCTQRAGARLRPRPEQA